ncbi:MAG: apolipoprotein N-acyltransferase [Pseudomonadota bacterium]|nr:apolipoprotein N-acyltransferase [Pseudomonadota bacterium]
MSITQIWGKKTFSDSLLAGAIFSAATLYLSFNLHAYSWVWAFITLIPLLMIAEKSSSRRRACGIGLLAGFSFNFIELFWITNSIAGFTSLPQVVVTIVMGLLALYMALYLALFTGLWHYLRNLPALKSSWGNIISALTAAAAWILFEDLRSSFMGGFPWHPLGLTQIDNQLFNWLLPWGGVRLLSGLIVLGNIGLYLSAHALFKKRRKQSGLYTFSLLGPLLILALLAGKNVPTITTFPAPTPTLNCATSTKIVVVQPNIPQKEKWRPENRDKIIEKMIAMTRKALKYKPDLIVWPESALPLLLEKEMAISNRLQELVRKEQTSLMLGGPRYIIEPQKNQPETTQKRLYNSIFLFTPDNQCQIYNKIKLVPYGEFTPLSNFFPFISKIVPGLDYSSGNKIRNFRLAKGDNRDFPQKQQLKIAPSVCFEGVFPAFTARFFGAGANLLVNLTNDAWFGDSPGPRQHLLNIRLRALENRSYIVRCANTGISAIINQQGEIEQQLPLNQEGLIETTITPCRQATFFARHPDLPAIVAGSVVLLSFLMIFFRRWQLKLKA